MNKEDYFENFTGKVEETMKLMAKACMVGKIPYEKMEEIMCNNLKKYYDQYNDMDTKPQITIDGDGIHIKI